MPNEQKLEEAAQLRREECRKAVRRYLVERPTLAFHPRVITRTLNANFAGDYSETEVDAALAFLQGDGQVEVARDAVGATRYYQSTTKGVLAHERGE